MIRFQFEKGSGRISVFQRFKLAQESLKFCKNVAAVWDFLQEIAFNHLRLELIKFLLHKFRDHFVNL